MAISFVAAGAFNSSAAALSAAMPVGIAVGDYLVLAIETANQTIVGVTGWSPILATPPATGTPAAAGGVSLSLYAKFAIASEPSASVPDSGDHQAAQVFAFRGVDKTRPLIEIENAVDSVATTAMAWPSVNVPIPGATVVFIAAMDIDAASTATCTGFINAALTGITKQADNSTATGAGGGIVVATATMAVRGSTGITTATGSTATTHAYAAFSLRAAGELTGYVGYSARAFREQFSFTPATFEKAVGATYGEIGATKRYVAVAQSTGTSGSVGTSSDGLTWSFTNYGAAGADYVNVAFGNARFIVVPSLSTGGLISTNGTTWSAITLPTDASRQSSSFVFGNGVFFLPTFTSNNLQTTDGTTWTAVTVGASAVVRYACFDGKRFVAYNTGSATVYSSTDLTTWVTATLPFNANSVAGIGGKLVAVSSTGQMATSPDGVNWTTRTSLPTATGYKVWAVGRKIHASASYANAYHFVDADGQFTSLPAPAFGLFAGLDNPAFGPVVDGASGAAWLPNGGTSGYRATTAYPAIQDASGTLTRPAGATTGVGSSAGTGVASAVGASTLTAVGSSAGTGVASAVGASTLTAVGSSAGTGVASAVNASAAAFTATAQGIGVAFGVGRATVAAQAIAFGAGSASGAAASTAASSGASSGTSANTAVSAAVFASAAVSIGASFVSGVGAGAASGVAVALGTSTTAAVGISTFAAVGSASGASLAAGYPVGFSTISATATSAGTSAAAGVGVAVARAVLSGSGLSAAIAVGAQNTAAAGSTVGVGAAGAVGAANVSASATSAGVGTAFAVGTGRTPATGSSVGTGAASGVSAATSVATGSSVGTGAAFGVGVATSAATGSSVGTGAASGVSAATSVATG